MQLVVDSSNFIFQNYIHIINIKIKMTFNIGKICPSTQNFTLISCEALQIK